MGTDSDVEFDHVGNPNPSSRSRRLITMTKNRLITEVLNLEERNALLESRAHGAVYLGHALTEDGATAAENLARKGYNSVQGIEAAHVATIVRPENTRWILDRLRSRYGEALTTETVIEIGAGIGYLAIDLARVCKRVIAIEADPLFSRDFGRKLYDEKPKNLTWIFDVARPEMAEWVPKADIVIVVTGSDEVNLRKLAQHFVAPGGEVIMPWQDWNGGRAVIDCSRAEPSVGPATRTPSSRLFEHVEQPQQEHPGVGVTDIRDNKPLFADRYSTGWMKPQQNFRVLDHDRFGIEVAEVPWALVEPLRGLCLRAHNQTLEVLNERGGLSPVELYCHVHQVPFQEWPRWAHAERRADLVKWFNYWSKHGSDIVGVSPDERLATPAEHRDFLRRREERYEIMLRALREIEELVGKEPDTLTPDEIVESVKVLKAGTPDGAGALELVYAMKERGESVKEAVTRLSPAIQRHAPWNGREHCDVIWTVDHPIFVCRQIVVTAQMSGTHSSVIDHAKESLKRYDTAWMRIFERAVLDETELPDWRP